MHPQQHQQHRGHEMIEEIKTKLNSVKIREMQLDPNGLCNVGCWYCPVRYRGNPTHTKNNMPKELLRKILKNIFDEKHNPDGLIHSDFYGFYTAHYNEVLLYKHFDYMLELCREFNFFRPKPIFGPGKNAGGSCGAQHLSFKKQDTFSRHCA